MFVVSIDLGYRYVKGVNSRREKIILPSFVSTGHRRQFNDLFGQSKSGIHLDHLHVVLHESGEEKQFFVGELACKSRNPIIPFAENKIRHFATRAMVSTATGLLTHGNEGRLHITSGLPLMQFQQLKNEMYHYLKGLDLTVELVHLDGAKSIRRVKFDRVTLFPQGAGAVFYVTTAQRNFLDRKNIRVGLVDIGGKTTEALMFQVAEGVEVVSEYCDTFDLGTSMVEDRVREVFYEKTGRRLDDKELHESIQQRVIYFRGKEYSLQQMLEEAREELALNIQEELNRLWGKAQDFVYLILWAGGGAADLYPHLRTQNSLLVKDPQFANAMGNLFVAEAD